MHFFAFGLMAENIETPQTGKSNMRHMTNVMPTNSAGSIVCVLTATRMARMLFFKVISNKDPVLAEVAERS